ncbi:MAG: hypothetical protein JW797_06510 [Bradymonadales bacterium]|nr:hypothetical protein [Bradymonadales bacterium]
MSRRFPLLFSVVAVLASISACLLEDSALVESKEEIASGDTSLAVTDLGSADSGSATIQGDLPWCELTVANLTRQVPYHFWFFEGGCPDAFIDLASRLGQDIYLLLYRQTVSGGWELIAYNDDYYQGTYNAGIEISTEASASYLVVATTYNYLAFGRRVAAEYHLTLSCRDAVGECIPPNQDIPCGASGLGPCPEGMYCNWDESIENNACSAADIPGVCEPLPTACPRVLAPVCGCDGQTYTNSCYAAMNGAVDVLHDGQCLDGRQEGESCGGFAAFPCAEGLVCDYSGLDFSDQPSCGADYQGVCVQPQIAMCPAVWAPVCGCDGRTYGNDCNRRAAYVALAHLGACEQ